MTDEANYMQRRMIVTQSVSRVLQRIGLALPGDYGRTVQEDRVVVTDEGTVSNDLGVEAYVVSFRLPRFNGKAHIMASALNGLFDRNALFPPQGPFGDDFQHSTTVHRAQSAVDAVITTTIQQAARELRGRAIMELITQDWDIKDTGAEHWQKLENVAIRLMAMVDERRK